MAVFGKNLLNIFKLLTLFYIFLLFLNPINSGDFFHHINTGKYIVEHFSLPYTDTFSFTAYGRPWVAHAWGAGVLLYLIYSLLGDVAISILFSLLGVGACLFAYLTVRKIGINTQVSLALVLLTASIISLRWPTRPEILGPFFLSLLVYLLVKIKQPSLWITLLFFIWGILYSSSAFLGIGILIIYIIVSKIFTIKALGIIILSILACMFNGYGSRSFLYIFQIPSVATHIAEWHSISQLLSAPELSGIYKMPSFIYITFTLLCISSFLLAFAKQKQILRKDLFFLFLALSIVAPFKAFRFINLSPFLVIPFLGICLSILNKKMQLVFICLAFLLGTLAAYHNLQSGVLLGIDKTQFPPQVIEYMKKNNINGNIFTMLEIGSYFSYTLPNSKVSIDTRDDLYQPTGIFEDLTALAENKIPTAALLAKYDANIIIDSGVNNRYYHSLLLRPDWYLAYVHKDFFVILHYDLVQKYNVNIERNLRLPDN